MRKLALALTTLLALAGAGTAYAEETKTIPVSDDDDKRDESRGRHSESVTYSGIGLTRVTTDFDNLKSAVNLNFNLGFRIPTFDIFGAEVEIGTTVIPGENTSQQQQSSGNCGGILQPPCPGNNVQANDDLAMSNIAVYGVLRSPGRFYGMGKYGYRYLNTSIAELQEHKSGAAWGLGGGYRWGESLSGVEVFYTHFSEHVKYVGFSIAYGFGGHHDRD